MNLVPQGEPSEERVPHLSLAWSSIGSPGSVKNIAALSTCRGRPAIFAQANGAKICLLLDDHQLIRALDFWTAFSPNALARTEPVKCLCIFERKQSATVWVAGAAGDCIVIWSASSNLTGRELWHVHSQICTGQGEITCLDLQDDFLLVGTRRSLTSWSLSESRQLWTRQWLIRTPRAVKQAVFCPDEARFAAFLEKDQHACIWSFSKGSTRSDPELIQNLRHSRPILEIVWRKKPEEIGQTTVLLSRTLDGTVRLWAPVVDEPLSMRLWYSIDQGSMTSRASRNSSCSDCFYLDAQEMVTMLRASLHWLQRDLQMAEVGIGMTTSKQDERTLDLKRSRARRLEHLVTDTPDMLAMLEEDGTLIIRALANVDRRPPMLCQSFVVLKMATSLEVEPSQICSITAHALSISASSESDSSSGSLHLHLSSGDVFKLTVSPSLLFDGIGRGLVCAKRTTSSESLSHSIDSSSISCETDDLIARAETREGQQVVLTISDRRAKFFSAQAEAQLPWPDSIVSLAWSPSSLYKSSHMLAVASSSRVCIVCRRNLDFIDRLRPRRKKPRWTTIAKADMDKLAVGPITGIGWHADGSLLVAAGGLLLAFSHRTEKGDAPIPDHESLVSIAAMWANSRSEFDPEYILQCLLWGQLGLASQILLNRASLVEGEYYTNIAENPDSIKWEQAEVIEKDWSPTANHLDTPLTSADSSSFEKDRRFRLFQQLRDELQSNKAPRSVKEEDKCRLISILDTTLEVQRQRKMLDVDALRYLIAFRHTLSLKHRSELALDYNSFLWATSSQTQERLLPLLDDLCINKMDWNLARQSGVFLWLRSHDDFRARAEMVAKQQFAGQDDRDPTSCTLLYYALGKHKLVANLWKQAYWHGDQKKMLAFLSNDFSQPRWQSAALKNAFALLSQRRFEMAASFFILGGGLQDAVNVCVRNLGDLSLAVAIARLTEGGTDGPVFKRLLRRDAMQEAFRTGNRSLAVWAMTMLDEKEAAMHAICQPLQTLVRFLPDVSTPPPLMEEEAIHENAFAALHLHRLLELEKARIPDTLPSNIEARLLLEANRMLAADGLNGLGLAILRTHQLHKPPVHRPATNSKRMSVGDTSTAKVGKVMGRSIESSAPASKLKVASLMEPAKATSAQQAEAAFDVKAFNF